LGNYFGSKATSGLYQAIISIMPPHETYIETHLGGGAIMKRKPESLKSIGIDKDSRALNEFTCSYPVDLINGCAHEFLRRYDYTGRELIYSDPPYLASTRTSDRNYRFEYTDELHIELLELLKTLPCHIILSGYPSLLTGYIGLVLQEKILLIDSALNARQRDGKETIQPCLKLKE